MGCQSSKLGGRVSQSAHLLDLGIMGNSPGLSFERTCTFSSASKLLWEDQENKVPKKLPQVTPVLLGTDPRACQVPGLSGKLWRKLPSIGQSLLIPLDLRAAHSTRIAIWLPKKRPLLSSLGPKDPPCSAELTHDPTVLEELAGVGTGAEEVGVRVTCS